MIQKDEMKGGVKLSELVKHAHKTIHLPAPDGKLTPELIRSAAAAHTGEHTVLPRLVYISNTTELGTVYGRACRPGRAGG